MPRPEPGKRRTAEWDTRALLHALSHALKNDLHSAAINLDVLKTRLGKRLSEDQAAPLLRHLDIAAADVGALKIKLERGLALMDVVPPRPARSTAERIVKKANREIRPLAQRSAVEVAVSGEAAAVLTVDEAQVVKGLSELLRNAVEATAPGGVVQVGLRESDRVVEIAVVNSVESTETFPAELPEPFHSTKPGHVGVGLALARRLLLQNGADLAFMRHGSRVEVRLILGRD